MAEVRRYITVFSNETEELVGEVDLTSFSLKDFQKEFNEKDANNPMYDCYIIYDQNLPFLTPFLAQGVQWDFNNYAYFLEAETLA